MHIPPAAQLLAVLSLLLAEGTASPIAWPEEKLEAINVLRARGASEDEIAALYPRPLVAPGRVPNLHLSHYPTAHVTDTTGSESELFEAGKDINAHNKQRRLTETVGRRDRDLKKRA